MMCASVKSREPPLAAAPGAAEAASGRSTTGCPPEVSDACAA
jgi:hypothetical protein